MARRRTKARGRGVKGRTISIEWEGLEELLDELERMPEMLEQEIMQRLTKYGMLVEEGTKALAPHDRGDLEDSINFSRARKVGTSEFQVDGGTNSPYAIRQHEAPARQGVYPKWENGAKFPNYYKGGRGARTRGKPAWRGELAGRKYMVRAIDATEKDWNRLWDDLLTDILKGRR